MSVQVFKHDVGFEIALSANYVQDQEILKLIKRLPGTLRRNQNSWFVLYDNQDKLVLTAKVQTTESKIKRIIQKRIQSAVQVVGTIRDLPELTVSLPVRRPLYPFQNFGVAYCLQHRRVIIGDQPGLGKTSQASAVLLAGRVMPVSTLPALIVCPTTIKRKWQKELMIVAGLRGMVLTEKEMDKWPYRVQSGQIDAVIVNYEGLTKYFVTAMLNGKDEDLKLKDIQFKETIKLFKTVIIDEVHKCKNPDARRSKLVKGVSDSKEWILALTGTPLVNQPSDLAAQLAIIGRINDFGGWKYFISRYCAGGRGKSNLEELNYRLTELCFYKREKKDVLHDLPDKTIQIAQCDIDNRPEYDHAEAEFEKYLYLVKHCTEEQVERKLRGKFMVQLGVLREISARGKLEAVREWGDNLLDAGEKIVIFCNLLDIIDRLHKIFPGALEISGRIPSDTRDRYVTLFQTSPKHKVIICNEAGGVGIDLFASSNVGHIEEPWTWADFEQRVDRLHRNGQKNAVLSTSFVGVNTMDEFVHEKILDKKDLHDVVTGTRHLSEEVIDTLLNIISKHKNKPLDLWENDLTR
jgi:SWI/SNF-related matrix-associated actin-dependent regulator 1 of chromatin subfamily A